MVIQFKTKNKVTNLDALNGKDAYALAVLNSYDALNHSGTITYIMQRDNLSREPIVTKPFHLEVLDVDNLFNQLGLSIPAGGGYDAPNRQIIATAFQVKLGIDGMFGLTSNDWEIV
jgi:hypothetical protein